MEIFGGRIPSPVRFAPGEVVATPGALAALDAAGTSPVTYLARHLSGDWGEVGEEDWQGNEDDLRDGNRLLSVYTIPGGIIIWIITEWDRSVTTILLPEDY